MLIPWFMDYVTGKWVEWFLSETKSYLVAHEPWNKHVFIQFRDKYASYCFELRFGKFKLQSTI